MCNQIENPNFGHLLSRSHYYLVNHLNRSFQQAGIDLTKDQFLVLKLLWEQGPSNQQFISNSLQKEKYNITKLVDGLEKRGYVVRKLNKKDRRLKVIHLTKKGNAIRPDVEKVAKSGLDALVAGIHPNDLEVTKRVLSVFIENLSI